MLALTCLSFRRSRWKPNRGWKTTKSGNRMRKVVGLVLTLPRFKKKKTKKNKRPKDEKTKKIHKII